KTIARDGFIMEAGADSLLTEKPWAAQLARRLGLEAELIPTRAEFRKTYVVRRGRPVEIPTGFSLLAPMRLWPVITSSLFSPWGKIRMALEPMIPRRDDASDESLASFVTRRLGREVLDRVAQPLAGGIYTADPSLLSMRATMPRFVEMEKRYGSLMRGMRAAEAARAQQAGTSGARWSLFLSLREGVGALADALVTRLEGSIRRGADVAAIESANKSWRIGLADGSDLEVDAVICAAPAYTAARLLRRIDSRLADHLGYITYSSAATVNLTWRVSNFPKAPDAFGFVVPALEHRKIIAGSFSSLKYEGRAPEGFVLARVFLGGVLQSDMMNLSDDEMIAAAREEFRELYGVTAAPGLTEVHRWPASMPQYAVGHLDRVAQIEQIVARIPNLFLAGAAYRGVGIPDSIRSGELAAEAAFDRLGSVNGNTAR
ncbi:MAG TPA: protoporphyrinogen oxidase, partial [Candidatus Binataceae bacterium]|nr:protoporphyrinogen oxidase [Candidatus Binataceae bacterium]